MTFALQVIIAAGVMLAGVVLAHIAKIDTPHRGNCPLN